MKTIIKLALAALITYAAWNGANAWLTYFKFKDAVTELAQFGSKLSEEDLKGKVLQTASEYSVPLTEDDVKVRRENSKTFVDASYTQPINVLPWYVYPYTFELHVDALTLEGSLK